MSMNPHRPDEAFLAFWREPHYATLTTIRPDGTPHVVPVGVTYDPSAGLARVTARIGSVKVRNVLGADGSARAAVCQNDGPRWATLEGTATVRTDADSVAEAVRRYEERYGRRVAPDPERVVIEIALTRAMGNARRAGA